MPERDFDAGSNLEFLIAGEMALVAEQVLREPEFVKLNEQGLVKAMAAAINDSPSRYDETKMAILGLMERFDLTSDEVTIPARQAQATAPAKGVHVLDPYTVLFAMDGNRLGLRSIADAVQLASQIVPGADGIFRAGNVEEAPSPSTAVARGSLGARIRRALKRHAWLRAIR
jgi:hypothetical protein